MSFTRKMLKILTKRILTCSKKRGYSAFWFKIAQKLPVFRKAARSCSLTKKLLKILKVAKKLPSRIWKGLTGGPDEDVCQYINIHMDKMG